MNAPSITSAAAPVASYPPQSNIANVNGNVKAQANQLFATGTGAVGQAAAHATPGGALFGVATMDSVTNYATQASPITKPAAGASVQV